MSRKIIENWVVRTIVAVTARDKIHKNRFKLLKLFDLLRDALKMLRGNRLYVGARAIAILLERQERSAVVDGEAE